MNTARPVKLFALKSTVTYADDEATYYDVPLTWGVMDRAELQAPAEILFQKPDLVRRINIHQIPWEDEYMYTITTALQRFTEDEVEAFRKWLKIHRGVDAVARQIELPLPDDSYPPVGFLPLGWERRLIEIASDENWDLPFTVAGTVYLDGARFEPHSSARAEENASMRRWSFSRCSRHRRGSGPCLPADNSGAQRESIRRAVWGETGSPPRSFPAHSTRTSE